MSLLSLAEVIISYNPLIAAAEQAELFLMNNILLF